MGWAYWISGARLAVLSSSIVGAQPPLSSAARNAFIAAAYWTLVLTFALRFIIESIWLLPSPVGDGALFLTASVNYCRSHFLGTTAYSIDPTGQSRMVWHGFVSPMLFGALSPRCEASSFFIGLWLVRALTCAGIIILARRRNLSSLTAFGLGVFAVAAQYLIGFRPESLAILLIILAEISLEYDQHALLGAAMGVLLCTQPTVAALHGLVMLITRFDLVKHGLRIGTGYILAVLLLVAVYPFPLRDLVSGILLQAKVSVNRSDAGLISYYFVNPWLPGWGVLFVAAWLFSALRKPLLVLSLPALWFFGPRVPPTTYNVIPICLMLLLTACRAWPGRIATFLAAGSLLVGMLGLGLITARDALTIYTYGDTLRNTRDAVDQIAARGNSIRSAPPFLALTNPSMRSTDPSFVRATTNPSYRASISLYAVNGFPKDPCPKDGQSAPVSLSVGKIRLFNSNSGWMVYTCRAPDAPE